MAGGITETGTSYSRFVGFVYVFNLIVGTGALTMPLAFHTAGWLLSLIVVVLLGGVSYVTVTFVTEAMAIANAKLVIEKGNDKIYERQKKSQVNRADSPVRSDEDSLSQPLLPDTINDYDPFDIKERVELGQMAAQFFNKGGVLVFYLCMVLYLYGDLSIYAVAVPKSMRDVICTYKLPSNISCVGNSSRKLDNSDLCWEGNTLSRMDAYRLMVAVFCVLLGPFTFFNIQKTKYLQLFTTVTRWLAFGCMVVLALIRLAKHEGEGHPVTADFSGIPNLFGVCVYSFMCHHSLPSLLTPINNKSGIFKLILVDFVFILCFYALISFTGIYAFELPNDLYTLNFLPDECDASKSITNVAFIQYFLALFPVFTLSTNFPIISITLRNNLKTMFYREHKPFGWCTDKIVFPLGAILLPFAIAFATDEVEILVGITGSYAGAGIQYVIPAALVYFARKQIKVQLPYAHNRFTSPFKHTFWVMAVFIWTTIAVVFVTVNHIVSGK